MRRIIIIGIAIVVPVLVLATVSGLYAYDELINDERIGRNVSAGGVDLSGMTVEEATAAMTAYEESLATRPAPFGVDGHEVEVTGSTIALDVDEEAVAAAAHAERRRGGFFGDIAGWFGAWWSPVELAVPIAIDEGELEDVLDGWDRDVIDEPAYEGAVLFDGGTPVPEYPRPGQKIDRSAAIPLIVGSLESPDRQLVVLPLTDLTPIIDDADVDAAVAVAEEIVDDAVTLTLEDFEGALLFSPTRLAEALVTTPVVQSPAELVVSLDPEVLAEGLASRLAEFSTAAVDATFEFDEETKEFTIVPSQPEIVVDVDALGEAVMKAALGSGRGAIPTTSGEAAAFTTAMAEAMGPIEEVSSFTTYHPCCASRVTNIHLIADAVDGAIVMPGETFSVNEHVGQRTTAKGYVRAGAIIQGRLECCDNPANIGGGTSQFGTTIYNAIFFACYDDIEHQPHSIYFSRYPFVREATLGYPKPDVIFLNDSDAIVYIDTSYTGTSITVTFYGNNGGRICEAERDGNTVTRVMTHPDGSVDRESWSWYYRKPLPPTTTTTEPPETTTTVPVGSTTTTTGGSTTTTAPPPSTTAPPPSSSSTTTTTSEPPPEP